MSMWKWRYEIRIILGILTAVFIGVGFDLREENAEMGWSFIAAGAGCFIVLIILLLKGRKRYGVDDLASDTETTSDNLADFVGEREKETAIEVSTYSGRKEHNWERTEHLMWAELRVKNKSTLKELKDVQVNVVRVLDVAEEQSGRDEYVIFKMSDWNATGVYWSERNVESKTLSISIPRMGMRACLVAFCDNSNGGQFVFNSRLNKWKVGGMRIEVEVSSSNSASLKKAFYIECHPNYLGGERAKFEFMEWDVWARNRKIKMLKSDEGGDGN